MDDKAELIEALVARMKAADDALHCGDAGPRKALWSTTEPVTVFGAAMSATGPAQTQATFDWVASRFTGFESGGWEILSADVSGDLAYVVAIEHTTGSIGGAPAESYSLRATTILRREAGQWRAFHRHADPVQGSEPARDRLLSGAAESIGARQARPSVVALDLLSRADDGFTQRLAQVRPDQWAAQTPCTEWDVRALVNHAVGANRRYTMLLHGATTDEVEATRAVDHLGDDPAGSFAATAAELRAAFGEPGAMARTAYHASGERTGAQLLEMRVLDIAVHTWDLARAIGAGESLDPGVVAFALTLHDTFDAGRRRGAFAAPPGTTPADGSAQTRLLYLSGRRPG